MLLVTELPLRVTGMQKCLHHQSHRSLEVRTPHVHGRYAMIVGCVNVDDDREGLVAFAVD